MRVAILQAAAVDESLALCDVTAVLRQRGHRVCLFLEDQEPGLPAALARFRPEIVFVQAAYMAEAWTRHAVRLVEGLPGATPPRAVLVGTAATFDAELCARVGAFGALMGELDACAPAFLAALTSPSPDLASVPALRWHDGHRWRANPWGEPPDLDRLPLPARDVYFARYPFLGRFPWKRFTTGRGCVHSCGFCYLPGLREGYGQRPTVRRKSVDRVIAEVHAVRASWPLQRIHFADDLFAPSRPWLEELAERFPREVGLPFSCNTSPETVTETNAALLARAGAVIVGIGLETGSEAHRIDLLGRPTRDAAIRRAAERLARHGIRLQTFNMLANPGEPFADALSTLTLNQELGAAYPRVNLAYPAPGSHLEQLMAERGTPPLPPDAHARADWRAWCAEGDPAPFEVLQRLFRLAVRTRLPPSLVSRLAARLDPAWLAPLALYDATVEARWSGVSPLAGLRYGLRAGKPNGRVTYHESIP